MPISAAEFFELTEADVERLHDKIHAFLVENDQLAFTSEEIAEALELSAAQTGFLLEGLLDKKLLRMALVDDDFYFTARID